MNRNEQPAVTHREAWADLVSILKSVHGVDHQANEILRWIDHHCCIPTSTLVETNRRLNRIRQTQESEIRGGNRLTSFNLAYRLSEAGQTFLQENEGR